MSFDNFAKKKGDFSFEISFVLAQSCACVLLMLMSRTSLHRFVLMFVLMFASSKTKL